MQMAVGEDETRGVVDVHQVEVVGRDDDGGAELLQFHEQAQQAAAEAGIDIAGRLVGQQQLRPSDQGAGDGGTLLLAAGKHGRHGVHALAEADPTQQFDDFGAIARLLLAEHTQGQSDVLVDGEVVEQAEILEDHAHPAAEGRQRRGFETRDVLPEQVDEAARRLQRHQDKAHQRRLAGAGRPGQILERARRDAEVDVLQHLRPHAISQADILEPNQAVFLISQGAARRDANPRDDAAS